MREEARSTRSGRKVEAQTTVPIWVQEAVLHAAEESERANPGLFVSYSAQLRAILMQFARTNPAPKGWRPKSKQRREAA